MKKLKVLRWLPGVIISGVIVYFVLRSIDFDALLAAVRNINIWTVVLMAVLTVVSLGARSIEWMKLLPGVKFTDAFFITNESYLFNNLVPRSGEVIKALLFAKPSQRSTMEIVSSVVIERLLDLVVAASMFLITLPFIPNADDFGSVPTLFLLLFGFVLVALFFVALKADLVKKWLSKIGQKNKLLNEKIIPHVELVIDGFKVLTNFRQFSSVLLWVIITWSLWTLILVIGLSSIHPDFRFWWAIFTEGVLALGIALPSAPAGLGVYEGAMVFALSAFGIKRELSFGIAIVIHLMQIIITSALGVIGVIRQGDSISKIISRIKLSKDKPADNEGV